MKLANVVRGRLTKPLRITVYGVDGIGKSTFAAQAPAPVFIGVEDGTATLDVPRFPEPTTLREVHAAVDELEFTEHAYRTLVVDTLDWLEPMIWTSIVGVGKRTDKGKLIESINDFGFAAGLHAAKDEFRVLCSRFDRLRALKGMSIILLAHAHVRTFRNPAGDDFERYQLKLDERAAGLVREWSDIVLFATHELYTHKANKHARAKGISTGARFLYTTRTAAYDAKNRHNLPEAIPLDFESFTDAVAAGVPEPKSVTLARIAALLEGADEPLRARVQAALAKDPDPATLARIANKLTAQLSTQTQPESEGSS
jgi:hypothetical protein